MIYNLLDYSIQNKQPIFFVIHFGLFIDILKIKIKKIDSKFYFKSYLTFFNLFLTASFSRSIAFILQC